MMNRLTCAPWLLGSLLLVPLSGCLEAAPAATVEMEEAENAESADGPQDPRPPFEPGGPPRLGPGGPGGFGGPMGQERKLVRQFDKDGDRRLDQEERRAAREFLKKERATGGRGGFGPGGPRPGGRGGFGPDGFLAAPLLQMLDANKDGKLAKDELTAGVKRFFAESDKDRKGSLAEAQLAEAVDRIFPRPQGFPAGPPPGPPGGGPGGPRGGFGPGGMFAGAMVRRADANKDGRVTLAELVTAAEALFQEADRDKDGKLDETELGGGIALLMPEPPGFGPPGMRGNREPPKPGPRVAPADVQAYPNASLYEPTVLRTLFLEFENTDWEAELADFHGTDVEVPATLTVDGKKYPRVGVHFRGMSSYMMVPAGYKRSLNLSLDFVDPKQRLHGYKTLNLLNCNGDPSLLSSVLYSHIARQHIPAPKANMVKVVINGESWGVYANVQQFNREFLAENYKTTKGTRWKVRGSPMGGGGLEYLGEDLSEYKRRYEVKSGESEKAWKGLVTLCRTLNQTPPDKLEAALKPMLDLDGLLWFLALDVALVNEDGYWIRASDYSLFRDEKGKFHIIPHDMNEAFHEGMGFGPGGPGGPGGRPGGPPPGGGFPPPGGPGGPGGFRMGPRGAGVELDPLVGLDDPRKPLRSRILAVPSLRAKYLANIRTLAAEGLDWKRLGPVVQQYRSLVEKEVEADTRKLMTFDAFQRATAANAVAEKQTPGKGPGRGPGLSLRAFAEQRSKYLLSHPEVQKTASSSGKDEESRKEGSK